MARPTLYKPEYPDLARKFCLLGATNQKLAEFFEVSIQTIELWIRKHDLFIRAIKEGREEADAKVSESLFNRANGYSCREDKIFCNTSTGEVTTVETVKHYPPDATSASFWLKNRQRDYWREKIDVESTVNVKKADEYSREELLAIIATSSDGTAGKAGRKSEPDPVH